MKIGQTGFHLAASNQNLGWKCDNEWAYLARQVPWDTFLGDFLRIVWGNFDQKQN